MNMFAGIRTQPSQETLPESDSRKLRLTLFVGLVACLVLIIASQHLLINYGQNRGYRLVRDKWELLAQQSETVNILVLGDSSSNQGVDTDYIISQSKTSALNLSTIGDAILVNDYWMLDEYISRVGIPNCVVAVHVYDVWHRPLHSSVLAQIPRGSPYIIQRLAETGYGLKMYISFLFAKHFRAYSENLSLKKMLMYPWRAMRPELVTMSPSGFYAFTRATPEVVFRERQTHRQFLSQNQFVPSVDNRIALNRMVQLAEENNFKLYLVNGPLFDGIFDVKEFQPYFAKVNNFLDDISNQSEHVQHLFAMPITFSEYEMQGLDHLTASSANIFTQRLIENIDCAISRVR